MGCTIDPWVPMPLYGTIGCWFPVILNALENGFRDYTGNRLTAYSTKEENGEQRFPIIQTEQANRLKRVNRLTVSYSTKEENGEQRFPIIQTEQANRLKRVNRLTAYSTKEENGEQQTILQRNILRREIENGFRDYTGNRLTVSYSTKEGTG